MKQSICIGIAVLGGVLLLLGILWGFIFPPEKRWTAEKAEQRSALQVEVHGLHMKVKQLKRGNTSLLGDDEPGEVELRYKEVTQQLDALNREFESATESPKTIANALRIVGMLSLLGGLIGLRAVEPG